MDYVWLVCRITKHSLGVKRDYYFEEDKWSPMHIANRYKPDETWHVLEIIHRLHDENRSDSTTYAPCKIPLYVVESWTNEV